MFSNPVWTFNKTQVKYDRRHLGRFLALYFVEWGVVINGVFVFLLAFLGGLVVYFELGAAFEFAWKLWAIAFGFSSVMLLPSYLTDPEINIEPQVIIYLNFGYRTGKVIGVLTILSYLILWVIYDITLVPTQLVAVVALPTVILSATVVLAHKFYQGLKGLRKVIVY